MNSREAFEAWARNRFGRGMVIQASNGPYVWDSVQDAWGVWQAATERAADLLPEFADYIRTGEAS